MMRLKFLMAALLLGMLGASAFDMPDMTMPSLKKMQENVKLNMFIKLKSRRLKRRMNGVK